VVSVRRSSVPERVALIRQAKRHDLVILFKTIGFGVLDLRLLRRSNPHIIFDYDDAVMFREQKYGRPIRLREFEKFVRTLEHCRAVVAGNAFLARFAEACGKPAIVLPTPVDVTKYIERNSEPDSLTIGWIGLSDGFGYLHVLHPALRKLADSFPRMKLRVISDKPFRLEGLTVENEQWQLDTEQANLSSFSIGIMPLSDTLWARGKCGYKILQYMAARVPVVASAIGANRDIISHGDNGFLAGTTDDWVRGISTLAADAVLRRKFAMNGRNLVENRYSLHRFADDYIKLMREVVSSASQ
jgi:glycosyltransferase involved in cell wall biosynthesis